MVPESEASGYEARLRASFGRQRVMQTLGAELGAIGPGSVDIELPFREQLTQQHIVYMTSRIPMGRVGQPEEVAALACFLASEEVTFSTGAVFDLSGGRATY